MRNTYRAVVRYALCDSDEEKIRQLRDGLQFVTMELVGLGCSVDQIETWLEEAGMSAQDEADSLATQASNSQAQP